jgi:hypothetical protein
MALFFVLNLINGIYKELNKNKFKIFLIINRLIIIKSNSIVNPQLNKKS